MAKKIGKKLQAGKPLPARKSPKLAGNHNELALR